MSKYSVLMSVYIKEKPENLRLSVESMVNQTIPPEDFVLYCDGLLTNELYEEIDTMKLLWVLETLSITVLNTVKTTLLQEWTAMILQYLKEWSFSLKRL